MSHRLFRQQAVDAKANTQIGESYLASPLRFKVVAFAALLVSLGLLGIVVFGSYTKKETVVGYITTTEGNVRVYPTTAGTISEIYVSQADKVVRGQPLAKISTARSTGGEHSVQTDIRTSMSQEAAALRKQIGRTIDLASSQETALIRQVDNVLFQIGVIKEQRAGMLERLQLADKNHTRVLGLRKTGVISDVDVDRSRSEVLSTKLNLNDVDRDLAEQRGTLNQLEFELAQLPTVRENRVAELEGMLQHVEQRIAEIEGQDALIVVAPIDGVVSDLGRRVGQLISSETPFVTLLPNQTSYYAELYVPSRSIGAVREGATVQIRYDAYPYQKFGVYAGTVTRIATTPVRSYEADAPIQILEPSYLLTVELDDQRIMADDGPRPLQAGMSLRADIVRDKRRIVEWMFDPVVTAVQRMQ